MPASLPPCPPPSGAGETKGAEDGPPKVDTAEAGAAEVVKEDGHTEQVDFKKLTTEEAFQVLGVCSKH